MFKFHPVGTYMINVCTNLACQLLGGEELLAHAEEALGIKAGGTTADGMFTIEDVECIAACTEAPCLQVNYRYKLRLTTDDLDQLIDDIRNGRATDIPEHGTLGLIRQHIPAGAGAGIVAPEQATERPVWLARNDAAAEGGEA
jgi:NADH-quinone oxidoreductase subunit E